MLRPRTLKVLAVIVLVYGLVSLPCAIWPDAMDSPLGIAPRVPLVLAYLLHSLGLPGVLQNHGACGWGWCEPTGLGWGIAILWMLAVAWLLAWGIASLRAPSGRA